MSNVIRQDVVELSFDIGGSLKEIKKLQNDINELKKKLTGGVGDEEFEDLKDSAEKAKKPIKNLTEETKKLKDKIVEVGKKAGTTAFNGLKKLASISFKAVIAGIGAATVAIGGLVAKAVSAYAEFEQLKGGVETLFGAKGAQSVEEYAKIMGKSVSEVQDEYKKLKGVESTVINYANDAFKSAGLSANDYMNTVTSFSASLISSVGGDTKKAAELANMAIVDMSDNANKMGTDMGSLQYAYQGFAKQNYTMLDNLKLGYGGTKTEMERLIKDAAKMTDVQKKLGIQVDANSMSYGNIVKAIHVVQEQMYINGTTQKEAEGTITGSLNMVKAAWGNLMPALIKGGDTFDQCIDNLVYSADKFADNIMPAIEKALGGVGTLIEKLVPKLSKKFPELAKKLIPPLIKAAVELAKGLIAALPEIIRTIAVTIVDIFGEQFPIIRKIGDFFKNNADTIANSIKKIIPVVIALAAAFKGFKAVKGITAIFGGLKGGGGGSGEKSGGLFGGITSTFKDLAKTKPTTILKGMANLGIILGGFVALSALLMAIAPHMANLSDGKSLLEVISVIAVLGLVGTALVKFAQIAGRIPVSTVAKGLANMAIIIGGMTALFLLIGVTSLLDFNYNKILRLVGIIGVLGTVGTVLTAFAGIAGIIPIPVVLMGLANIGLVLGGLSVLIVAFGALTQIPGFTTFIESGGKILVTIFSILGEMVGSLVGGLLESLTSVLPKVGESIGQFGENIKPLFTAINGIDMGGVAAFFASLIGVIAIATANDIVGGIQAFFGGGGESALSKLGSDLGSFAKNAQGFFDTVAGMNEDGFRKATLFFECFAGLSNLPLSGGLTQWFSGEIDYAKIANGVKDLASQEIIDFFNTMASMPMSGFTGVEGFFKSLSAVGSLPCSGGVAQWFCGEIDYNKIASGIGTLTSNSILDFFTLMSNMPASAFTGVKGFFESLSTIGSLPHSGGIAQWFSGEVDYYKIAGGITALTSENILNFFTLMSNMPASAFTGATGFFQSLSMIGSLPHSGGIAQWFSGDVNYNQLSQGLAQLANPVTLAFFTVMANMPASAFSGAMGFFQSLSMIGSLPHSGGIAQWFSGDVDYYKIAGGLVALTNADILNFFNLMAGMKASAFTGVTGFFNSLSLIGNLPKSGGIAQWFDGEVNYDKVAEGFCAIAKNQDILDFFTLMASMPASAFTGVTGFFNSLSLIGNLPHSGGITNWFSGEVDYSKVANGVKQLSDQKIIDFYNLMANMPASAFSGATGLFESFCIIGNLPKHDFGKWFSDQQVYLNMKWCLEHFADGKIFAFFNSVAGMKASAFTGAVALFESLSKIGNVSNEGLANLKNLELSNLGTQLKQFGEDTKAFFTQVSGLNIDNLNGLWKSLEDAGKLTTDNLSGVIGDSISTLVDKISELPKKMGDALKNNSKGLSDGMVAMWKNAVEASVAPVNKLLDGANHILKEFGSNKKVISWQPYAKGTDGHKGGNAVVNDGSGAELVQMPNGRMFIPRGKNVFMPNAPKGMKVLNARKTAKLFGRSAPTFNYANGIGDIDIWSYYDNAKGLVGKLKENISYRGMSKLSANIGKGMVNTFGGQMANWIEKLFEEMGGMSIDAYDPSKGVSQWKSTVARALKMEGLYSAANVSRTLYQMQTESGGNPRAINLWDSNAKKGIPSKGLMQVIDPTFKAYARAGFDKNIYDPLSNILASVRYATSRYGSLERAYRGVGYSSGVGEVSMPQPVSMKYTPDNSYSGGRAEITENNTYSPVFNLTINGADNERDIKRKIKRWVNEAFEEVLDSMSRKNPRLREV